MESLILISNPGSASRKYALYRRNECVSRLHFEWDNGTIICTVWKSSFHTQFPVSIQSIEDAPELLGSILGEHGILDDHSSVSGIALRIVAPSSYFMQNRVVTDEVVAELEHAYQKAPLHIGATLEELHRLRAHFSGTTIVGVSDSAFHSTKPESAWNYGLPLTASDELDIKRFGYHGLSVSSAVDELHALDKLPSRVVVCHLGGGASVSAVYKGRGYDTTMGYSPLEGLVMATRSGSIDPTAVREIQNRYSMDNDQIQEYLNHQSGLLGLSGSSSDIRELLAKEDGGDHLAKLALATYVLNVQKSIGQMSAAMGGVDLIVFTGTVGERSVQIRERILANFDYLDFVIDKKANRHCTDPEDVVLISKLAHSRPVYVIPANEAGQMIKAAQHELAHFAKNKN